MLNENETIPRSGWIPLFTFLLGLPISVVLFVILVNLAENGAIALPIAALLFALVIVAAIGFLTGLCGLMAVQPNQARALLLFGDYKGTVRTSGFFWVNPFYTKTKVSLRIRNFETGSTSQEEKKDTAGQIVQHKSRTHGRPSKVNDRDGNPIEISAVVVWKVVNTAEALFEVDDYENFVAVQSEAAVRAMATRHPYDSEDHEVSLRGSADEILFPGQRNLIPRKSACAVPQMKSAVS
jgi:regulator of protease activity HflC (stomatin/prohibitin superfamily)